MNAPNRRGRGAEHVQVRRVRLDADTDDEPKREWRAPVASTRSVIVYRLPGGSWIDHDLDNGAESPSAYDSAAAAERLAAAIEAAK